MIMDRQTVFSDAQAVTVTAISTNVYDDANNVAISPNGELQAICNVNTTFVGGTSIKADLVSADDAALTSNVTTLVPGAVVVVANATAGTILNRGRVPRTAQRYLGYKYTVVGTMTAGNLTAALVAQTDDATYMPANTGLY